MTRRRSGDKQLVQDIMAWLTDARMYHLTSMNQWRNINSVIYSRVCKVIIVVFYAKLNMLKYITYSSQLMFKCCAPKPHGALSWSLVNLARSFLHHETYCPGETVYCTLLHRAVTDGILSILGCNEFIKVSRPTYKNWICLHIWVFWYDRICIVFSLQCRDL